MIRVTLHLDATTVSILDLLVEESDQSRAEVITGLIRAAHPVRLIHNPDLFDQELEGASPGEAP